METTSNMMIGQNDKFRFVEENSLQITFIGGSEEIIQEISNDVCAFFNQESVLVVHDVVDRIHFNHNRKLFK